MLVRASLGYIWLYPFTTVFLVSYLQYQNITWRRFFPWKKSESKKSKQVFWFCRFFPKKPWNILFQISGWKKNQQLRYHGNNCKCSNFRYFHRGQKNSTCEIDFEHYIMLIFSIHESWYLRICSCDIICKKLAKISDHVYTILMNCTTFLLKIQYARYIWLWL